MKTLAILAALLAAAFTARADFPGAAVDVRIRTDHGRELPFFPVSAPEGKRKFYAEATRGEPYTVVVCNRLNRRVGLVIAVDGRNVITGKKSSLSAGERMYVLEPYGRGEFNGWRTGLDRVNRFYFTSVEDSYAAAFKDESALGVIAVAVYAEVPRFEPPAELSRSAPAAPGAARRESAKSAAQAEDRAGTGFGPEESSPVRVVEFEPDRAAREKVYVKYEWRETLCRLGIIPRDPPPRSNRLWDDEGFAPAPPGRGGRSGG